MISMDVHICYIFVVLLHYMEIVWTFRHYSTAYLQDSCACSAINYLHCKPFTLDPLLRGAGNVALSRNPHFFKEFYCEFTIEAPSKDHRIMLTVNHLNIPKTEGCMAGMLKIFDGPLGEEPAQLTGICGAEEPRFSFRSNSHTVTLAYHQALSIIKHEKSFNLTFTYFRITEQTTACNTSKEFPCVNGLCIPRILECDGWNNCGDRTDETMDYHVCGKLLTTSDPMVGLAVGVSVASLLIIVMVCLIAYGVQRRKGPFFHERISMTRVTASNINDDEPNQPRKRHIRVIEEPSQEDAFSDPSTVTEPLNNIHTTLSDSEVHIHNNPLGNLQTEGAAVNKHIVRLELEDDTHSVASSSEMYAMGLHRDPPPPSYHSLFPDDELISIQ